MKKLFYLFFALAFLSCNSEPIDVNVMSFNVRYDNPGDSLNSWQYRKDVAAQIIKDQNIDILGAQEVLINQMNDLRERLPEFVSVGVGRVDGKEEGEFSALFYNKNRFTEVESGYFWLSETPEVAGSKGWDGACERVATWAKLKDKASGKEVFAMNTHLDHVGKVARQEGVTLLLQRATELAKGTPVILTGDFNARPESDVIKHVTSLETQGHLIDSRIVAKEVLGLEGTFHDFGRYDLDVEGRIDYIFVSDGVTVNKYESIPAKLNGIYLSDHTPIVAHLSIK
jgi:endonuclease/exonuclease/phosphatase family metal-dependent hydrolase